MPGDLELLLDVAVVGLLGRVRERGSEVAQLVCECRGNGEGVELDGAGAARRIPPAETRTRVGDQTQPRTLRPLRALESSAGGDVDRDEVGRVDEQRETGAAVVGMVAD